MKRSDMVRNLIRDYFVIFGILVIGAVFLTPQGTINRDYILLVMAFAALGDLPSMVFWSQSEQSEKSRRFRRIIHFVLIEAVVLVFGGLTGIASGFGDYVLFALNILVIYLLVRFITWRGDIKTADRINERLKDFKHTDQYD